MLAAEANEMLKGENVTDAIVGDILNPSLQKGLNSVYNKVQVILDASTSITVARHLALDVNSSARRLSFFLNPSGTDCVILAEDKNRKITLDVLEIQ